MPGIGTFHSPASLVLPSGVMGVGTLSPDDVLDAAIRINADCRENGTRFRLRELLEKELDTLLPNNADEIISDRSGAVGVGLLKVWS